jgi:hypothetical protein
VSKSSKTSSNSTTNTNQTLTTTPTNPQFVTDSVTGLQGHINNLLNTDPQSFVAGPSQLQSQAFAASQGLGGWQGGLDQAGAGARGLMTAAPPAAQATSGTLLDTNIDGYMNPYIKNVVDTTLSDADQNAGIVRAAQAAAQARDQKFSGSGAALTSALTEGQLARARASADAAIRAQGYDQATGLATNDLNRSAATSQFNAGQTNQVAQSNLQRQLAAAGLLGDLSNTDATQSRADLGMLSDLGGQQRQIQSQQAGAPLSLAAVIAGLNAQQPYSLFHGQVGNDVGTSSTNGTSNTTTTDPFGSFGSLLSGAGSLASGLGALGLGAGAAAGGAAAAGAGIGAAGAGGSALASALPFLLASDKRLKTDIETVGKDKAGRRVVSYRYKGEPQNVNRIGYIAQEIEKTDPDAVHTMPGGMKAVAYGLLSQRAA